MNDKDIIDIIDCIRNNDSLTSERTVDLLDKIMHDCKAKRIGEAIIEAVSKPRKSTDGFEGDVYQKPKRKRGRPRKTPNQELTLKSIRENGRANDF